MLTGTFVRSFDDKQRFAIPKRIRDVLGPANTTLFLAPGTDGSLAMYTEATFAKMGEQLADNPPTEQDVRAFSRLFYAQAQSVDLDRQGRVRLPPELCRWAGLEKEIVLLGVRDHLEIWGKEQWDSYLGSKQGQFDELAERAFDANLRGGASAPRPADATGEASPTKPR